MAEQDTAQATENAQPQTDGETPEEPQEELTFDGWLGKQDEPIKKLIASHTTGLKSALDSERDERKKLQRQIKELSKTAEDGSEMRQQLDKLNSDFETTKQKLAFVEEAVGQRVTNPGLAWIAAREGDLIDSRGRIDWDGFKSAYPELIEKPAAPTARSNAGSGTGSPPVRPVDMNDRIRNMAGRR